MKNYLWTQITLYEEDKNYPIWRRQERRSKYAVQLASWQLRSNSPKTSVCRQGFRNFSRKLLAQFISSLGFILMGLVSGPLLIFVFVPSFLALWWPKIDRKSGFPQLFAKTVGSIHFIPGIYTYGVSLWTPIDFRVRALIFGPLVAKNWPKIGVSATFRENCRLDSFHPWDLYLWGKSLDPYRFSCSCPHFWPSGGQKLTENRGFRNFSRKLSARFISSLGFILMG